MIELQKIKLNSNFKAKGGLTTYLWGRFCPLYQMEAINPSSRFLEIQQYCAEPEKKEKRLHFQTFYKVKLICWGHYSFEITYKCV